MESGQKIGYLILVDRFYKNKRAYWNCHCTLCRNDKAIREDCLRVKNRISCGCYKYTEAHRQKAKEMHPITDITGNVYGQLTVLGLSDKRNGKQILWKCQCSCGKIVDVQAGNLKDGNSTTCGDMVHRIEKMKPVWERTLHDLKGKVFGDWLVLYRDIGSPYVKWICECQNCGNIRSLHGHNLVSGTAGKDECRKIDLTGQQIGYWTVLSKHKRLRPCKRYCSNYLCRCRCGTEKYVDQSTLLLRSSLSCGCLKSKSNAYIINYLRKLSIPCIPEYSFQDLTGPKGGLLRFDVAIMDETANLICLIEYQGEQHYFNTPFGQQQREVTDQLKRNYCNENNIKLYEIKYDQNLKEAVDKIITQENIINIIADPVPSAG